MRDTWVYGLYSSDNTEEIRYIGVSVNPDARLKSHVAPYDLTVNKNPHKFNWIQSKLSEGNTIGMTLLGQFYSEHDAYAAEDDYIVEYTRAGHRLTNKASGGSSGITTPGEASDLARERANAVRRLPENREKARLRSIEASSTPEAIERSRAAAKERWNRTPKEDRTPWNKNISKYDDENRRISEYTGEPTLVFGSPEHRTHQSNQSKKAHSIVMSDPTKASAYKESRSKVGKLVSVAKKNEWESLSEEDRKLRGYRMSMGKRYNRCRRNGWVLELTPKENLCEEHK